MQFSDTACIFPTSLVAIAPSTSHYRMDSLLPPSPSPAAQPLASSTTAAATVDGGGASGDGDEKADGGGGGGASSLLEDLMGGLNLSGFGVSDPNEASASAVS